MQANYEDAAKRITTCSPAGELYPTQVRTTAHGISAGIAKLGALWASVWFNYLPFRKIFWFTACTCPSAPLTYTDICTLPLHRKVMT